MQRNLPMLPPGLPGFSFAAPRNGQALPAEFLFPDILPPCLSIKSHKRGKRLFITCQAFCDSFSQSLNFFTRSSSSKEHGARNREQKEFWVTTQNQMNQQLRKLSLFASCPSIISFHHRTPSGAGPNWALQRIAPQPTWSPATRRRT